MRHRNFFLLAGFAAICFILTCADSFADTAPEAENQFLEKVHGSIEYRLYPYFHDNAEDRQVVNEVIAEAELKGKLGDNFSYLLVPRVITDNDHLSCGVFDKIRDDGFKRDILTVKEGYMRFRKENFSASAGKQIFSWGTADMINPTDNINPRDFTDFIENEKLGVPSASFDYFRNNWKAELVFIPVFNPSRLPLSGTRWSLIPRDLPLSINDRDLPGESMKNAEYAARVNATLDGWDMSVSYFDGFESVPTMLIDMPFPLTVTPVFDKVRIWGADFSTTLKGFELHGETAYFNRDNSDRNDYLQYILGFNYTFSKIISDHNLKVTFEYAREETVDRADSPSKYFDLELSHVFKNSLMPKLVYEFDYRKSIELGGIYNINHADFIIEPKFIYKPADNWDIELGFDFIGKGNGTNTVFGRYSRNDRGFVKTKFSF